MGPMEVPQQTPQIVKVVHSQYEFGANYVWDRVRAPGKFCEFFRGSSIVKSRQSTCMRNAVRLRRLYHGTELGSEGDGPC